MKTNVRLIGVLMLTTLTVSGCGIAGLNLFNPASAATMKKYSVNSSKTLGQTNAKDNAIVKQGTWVQPSLPGINIQTVVLNLNTIGFKSSQQFISTFGTYNDFGITSEINGMYATYQCSWPSPTKVEQVQMYVTAPYGTSVADFKILAEKDLGFLATLPYTGSHPQQAKQWVIDTIKATKKPSVNFVEHSFGGVTKPKWGTVKLFLCPYTVQKNEPDLPQGINAELFITYQSLGFPLASGKGGTKTAI